MTAQPITSTASMPIDRATAVRTYLEASSRTRALVNSIMSTADDALDDADGVSWASCHASAQALAFELAAAAHLVSTSIIPAAAFLADGI